MGRRSQYETIAALVLAFMESPTWSQAALARKVNVGVKAVRDRLIELERSGMSLEREEDGNQVSWSVPTSWLPRAVALPQDSVTELVRLLRRLPQSAKRERILELLVHAMGSGGNEGDAVVAGSLSASDELHLDVVQEAADTRRATWIRYVSGSKGTVTERVASIRRVFPGGGRFVVWCHRDHTLKWFRIDGLLEVRFDPAPFHAVVDSAVETYVDGSVGGFHGSEPRVTHAFTVARPESNRVRRNLPAGLAVEDLPEGIRVTATTGSVLAVVRVVLGLGGWPYPRLRNSQRWSQYDTPTAHMLDLLIA